MANPVSETAQQAAANDRAATNHNRRSAVPRISVIIVSYNVKDFLQQTLLSLQQALRPFPHEIFVVDNASEDGSAELIRRQFPEVSLHESDSNLGFAKANNIALQQATGDYIVLINPDTIAQEDTFTELIAFLEKTPDAGMVSCKVLNPDGTLQLACRRSFPTPWVAVTRLTGLSRFWPKSKLFGKYNLTYLPEDEIAQVDAVSGSFMMLRKQTAEQIGPLDEDFFMYGEDLDWCLRVNEAGWKIYYVPSTQIIHFKGESSKSAPFDRMFDFNRAMALFVKKHFRQRYFFITYYLLILAIWARAAMSFIKGSIEKMFPLLIDVTILQVSLAAAILVKFGHLQFWYDYLPVNIVYSLAWLISLFVAGSYSHARYAAFRAALAIVAGFVFNSALTYFFKQYAFSRAVVLSASLFNLLLIAGWRFAFKLLRAFGVGRFQGTLGKTLLARRTLVVGDFSKGESILEKLKLRIGDGYDIIGLVSINPDDTNQQYNGWRVLADVDHIQEVIRRKNVQEVIFSTHRVPYDRVLRVISDGRSSQVNFKLIPSNLDVIIGKASIDRLSDIPLLEIDYKLAHRQHRLLKRVFDVAGAGLGLLLGAPFFLLLILINAFRFQKKTVALSDGRTASLYELARGGRLARLLWLLPVLTGRLSIVGRDLLASSDSGADRHWLKPGLTGLVQINRHRNLTEEEREKFQLFYLTNFNLMLDVEIILKTLLQQGKA